MKPAPFEYHAVASVGDAVGLLAEHGDDAKVLAGGQSLVPILALRLSRFEHLIDLNRVAELQGISRSNGHLRVGAMTRQAAAEHSAEVASSVPLLARAIPNIGHFQIRNRGTVGGSIAHADPASELPAVALTLGAEMEVAGPSGTRRIAAADFFESTWTTSMAGDELLVAVHFPVTGPRRGYAVEEVARRHGDFALVGVTCAVEVDGAGKVASAAIGLFGVGSTPVRATEAEQALVGLGADADLSAVAELVRAGLDPTDDVHASGAYRRKVAGSVAVRALQRALEEARNG